MSLQFSSIFFILLPRISDGSCVKYGSSIGTGMYGPFCKEWHSETCVHTKPLWKEMEPIWESELMKEFYDYPEARNADPDDVESLVDDFYYEDYEDDEYYDYTDIYYDGGYEEELDSEEIEAEKERKLQLQALKNEIQ